LLFSNPDSLRELYSAIEGVDLPPDIPVDINTLSDVLYMGQINDISFTIDNRLVVLIEHQSTINNNMPLRLLKYIAQIYEIIIDPDELYKTKLEKIPMPEFIVLYNGNSPFPEHKEFRLSDAFKGIEGLRAKGKIELPLELVVQAYNINHGHNKEILEKSKTLDGYSFFIEKIKQQRRNKNSLDESVKTAIRYCIENNVLKDFLKKHSTEVYNMLLEWNWDDAIKACREETYEEVYEEIYGEIYEEALEKGMAKGLETRNLEIARNLLAKGSTFEFIQEITGLPIEDIKKL